METKDFLKAQLDDVGYQLNAVFAGLTDEQWHAKVTPDTMSPAETANHLCDCYSALLANADGGEYEWGSLKIEDQSPANLYKTMMDLRSQAVKRATDATEERLNQLGSSYVSLHDAYHVGQLVTLRLKLGGFEPYSIYNH